VTFIRGRQIEWIEKKQQVPLDFARDDKWKVVTFIRGRQIGWTEKKQQVPFDFAQGTLSTSLRDDNFA
jgi:hypothetical protein